MCWSDFNLFSLCIFPQSIFSILSFKSDILSCWQSDSLSLWKTNNKLIPLKDAITASVTNTFMFILCRVKIEDCHIWKFIHMWYLKALCTFYVGLKCFMLLKWFSHRTFSERWQDLILFGHIHTYGTWKLYILFMYGDKCKIFLLDI